MLLLIALTVVVSFKTVGTLLVFGLLMAPAASAALFSRKDHLHDGPRLGLRRLLDVCGASSPATT